MMVIISFLKNFIAKNKLKRKSDIILFKDQNNLT